MEACYGGTDVMERSCAVARGIDINSLFSVAASFAFPLFPFPPLINLNEILVPNQF